MSKGGKWVTHPTTQAPLPATPQEPRAAQPPTPQAAPKPTHWRGAEMGSRAWGYKRTPGGGAVPGTSACAPRALRCVAVRPTPSACRNTGQGDSQEQTPDQQPYVRMSEDQSTFSQ